MKDLRTEIKAKIGKVINKKVIESVCARNPILGRTPGNHRCSRTFRFGVHMSKFLGPRSLVLINWDSIRLHGGSYGLIVPPGPSSVPRPCSVCLDLAESRYQHPA